MRRGCIRSQAEDKCGAVEITETREILSEDSCGNYEHLVTLTATDEWATVRHSNSTIVVNDTESPSLPRTCPWIWLWNVMPSPLPPF